MKITKSRKCFKGQENENHEKGKGYKIVEKCQKSRKWK